MSELRERPSIRSTLAAGEDARLRLLEAVADPIRLRILSLIRDPQPVRAICRQLDMAQPRISHHLGVLRACGLAVARPRGRERLYAWAPEPAEGPVRDVQRLLRRWLGPERSALVEREAAAGESTIRVSRSSPEIEDFLL